MMQPYTLTDLYDVPVPVPPPAEVAPVAPVITPGALPHLLVGSEAQELSRLLAAGGTVTVAARALPTSRAAWRAGERVYLPCVAWLNWYDLGPVYEVPLALVERFCAAGALVSSAPPVTRLRGCVQLKTFTLSPLGRCALALGPRLSAALGAGTLH